MLSRLKGYWNLPNNIPDIISSGLILLVFTKIIISSWITEDAYIFFRTIDNFVNGYGLRWNIDERVQAYTNPLWLLINIPFYLITDEVFLTCLIISFVTIFLAIHFATKPFLNNPAIIFVFFIFAFFSKSFIEFSTSGLENCLIFLLTALFALSFCGYYKLSPLKTILLFSCLAITRMDSILLVTPAFLFYILTRKPKASDYFYGFLPAILWFSFSLFYYGFLFPNTKYAKINTGIPSYDYFMQGLMYIFDYLKNDTSAFLLLITTPFLVIVSKLLQKKIIAEKPGISLNSTIFLIIGVLIHIAYVIKVGGDFMSGRFLTPTFFLSLIITLIILDHLKPKFLPKIFFIIFIGFLFGFAANSFIRDDFLKVGPIKSDGIADERLFYQESCTLASYINNGLTNNHPWLNDGRILKSIVADHDKVHTNKYIAVEFVIGMKGYTSSPTLIIDALSLSDPLMARMKIPKGGWRIGHFGRIIPDGYIHFRSTGEMSQMDPDLRTYYRELNYIISGPLFSLGRIETIIKFNLGFFDKYLQAYYDKHPY